MSFETGPFSRRAALQRFGAVTAAAILTDAVGPSAGAQGSGAKPLPRVSPESAGVSPEAVLAFLADASRVLAESLEGAIATVFRQVAMNRFEHLVHTKRRDEGELASERIGELWHESQSDLLGDAVEITGGYRSWWSYVPHFIGSPGYVYAYAYGQLLALAVYGQYEEQGEAFVPAYLELLSAGGSRAFGMPRLPSF